MTFDLFFNLQHYIGIKYLLLLNYHKVRTERAWLLHSLSSAAKHSYII